MIERARYSAAVAAMAGPNGQEWERRLQVGSRGASGRVPSLRAATLQVDIEAYGDQMFVSSFFVKFALLAACGVEPK